MRERHVKGQDLSGLVKMLRLWRKAHDNAPIPGLHPDDAPYFEHLRVMPGGWYPLDGFLRILHLAHDLLTVGGREGALEIGRWVLVSYQNLQGTLIKEGDPRATLEAIGIGWSRHFDFSTATVDSSPGEATITLHGYDDICELHAVLHISFLEDLLAATGATDVQVKLLTQPWVKPGPAVFSCTWKDVDALLAR